ncbi:MAG: hypothetical protein EAZ42_06590 [Verrucomicrobia bacterium]|nr:MAG: hypothetical protein EAZ42_06590 [Verrucomicrobiota bacterium]
MSKYDGEQVLVVPRALLEKIGIFDGIRVEQVDAAVTELLDPKNHFFMDRGAAEEDPSFKQLIPYCIFRCGHRVLHYTRGKSGGESRLHAKISIGVGGHVNPVDMECGRTGAEAYHAAVTREIDEELVLSSPIEHRIIALLNDESHAVGQVHLGIVHLIDLADENVRAKEDALADLSFADLEELGGPLSDRLETWSRYCVQHLCATIGTIYA